MSKTRKVIRVGIGDMNMAKAPDKIRTSGLGLCVGIILFDSNKKVAGMALIMLPDSQMAKKSTFNRGRYADTSIEDLVLLLNNGGSSVSRLKAKMVGGAQIFQFKATSDLMRIGPRNVEAVKKSLFAYGIPIQAEDIGGNMGRTIEFDPFTAHLHIRTVGHGERMI